MENGKALSKRTIFGLVEGMMTLVDIYMILLVITEISYCFLYIYVLKSGQNFGSLHVSL